MLDTRHSSSLASPCEDLETHASTSLCDVVRVREGEGLPDADQIIEEVPVALVFNGVSHAVMLASPCDLEDFATGFSLGEGIVEATCEIYDLDVQPACSGLVVNMTIASQRFAALKDRRRSLTGRTGCGLCGIESLDALAAHAMNARPAAVSAACQVLSNEAIEQGLRQLPHWQPLRKLTGASHGAAWCDSAGNIQLLREDVGRHNALDKLVGAMARQKKPTHEGFALITSRASYEMVQKAARAGITALVAVSAPTALAVQMAKSAGILLVGFARTGQRVVYSQPDRLGLQPTSVSHTLM